MKGLRAAEMCDDTFMEHVTTVLDFNEAQVSMSYTANLQPLDKARIVSDWSKLAAFMKTTFQFKLAAWKTLPLLLVGLGHSSVSKARELLWLAFDEWEHMSASDRAGCHPLTARVLSDDSLMRGEAEQFLRGEKTVSELPLLQRVRHEMMFIPILEQSIERRHALLRQRINSAPHHSAPYVSLVQRSHEIERLLSEPDSLPRMAFSLDLARTPSQVLQALDLQLHPEVQPYVCMGASKPLQRVPHNIVAALVYRCDLTSQFAKLTVEVPSKPRPRPSKDADIKALPWEEAGQGPGAGDEPGDDENADDDDDDGRGRGGQGSGDAAVTSSEEVWDRLLCKEAWHHCTQTASSNVFFSMAPRCCNIAINSLQHILIPRRGAVSQAVFQKILGDSEVLPAALADVPSSSMTFNWEPDAGGGETSEAALVPNRRQLRKTSSGADVDMVKLSQGEKVFFFRVLMSSLKRKKRPRTDVVPDLEACHTLVQHHHVRAALWDKKQVVVYFDSEGATSGNAGSSNLLSSPESLKSLYRWEVCEIKHCLKHEELPDAAERVLHAMCVAQGKLFFSASGNAVCDDGEDASSSWQSEGLEILHARGFVQRTEDEAGMLMWELVPSAASNLCCVAVLGNPSAFASPRPNVATKDMTRVELMLLLKERGFSFQVCGSKEEPPPFNVQRHGPKVFYLKAGASSLSKVYLLALSQRDTPGLVSVRHCQPEKYYKHLLGLTSAKTNVARQQQQHQLSLSFQVDTGVLMDWQPNENAPKHRVHGKRNDPMRPAQLCDGIPEIDGAAAGKRKRRQNRSRAKHEKSHAWGPAYLTFKSPNTWQATCHRCKSHKHMLGHSTKCTRSRTFKTEDEEIIVLRQLRHWLNIAKNYGSRVAHMGAPAMTKARASDAEVDAELEADMPPADYCSDGEAAQVESQNVSARLDEPAASAEPAAPSAAARVSGASSSSSSSSSSNNSSSSSDSDSSSSASS